MKWVSKIFVHLFPSQKEEPREKKEEKGSSNLLEKGTSGALYTYLIVINCHMPLQKLRLFLV